MSQTPPRPFSEVVNERAKMLDLKPGEWLLGADGPVGVVDPEGNVVLIQDLPGFRPENLS
ncbi:MAG: hypothetical protein A2786_01755 [Candidatus Chisholmbacteria bacterium RIFCSPHIGHO2_01_FULL_52_32]|uniref:Uncharacterized protein n=1 Tax=Candidatus Chisholmbacteria bacterium RIFCSPHIGHO2_01_FULL_52_32 TaxID=1797591 RepID=A0A1G1VS47_9BACT|nr:MAG: hypothetical protein A2786_01755 [Candidatus Chisholmbacteria bacterium RIFCSPHIGHO2_01_FULL_52_32]